MSIELKGNTDSSFSNDINISDKISLNATDGSASFAGPALFGSSSASTTQSGTYIDATGGVIVNIVTDTDSNRLWIGKNKNVIKSQIFASGAATFAGEIVTGVRDSQGIFMTPAGNAESWVSNLRVWRLGAEGNASFSGDVNVGSANPSSATTFGVGLGLLANAGFVDAQCRGDASQFTQLYRGYWGSTLAFAVYASGDATFSGKVTSSNVTAFKTALTSAVTASTDHASLKAAILSALASL